MRAPRPAARSSPGPSAWLYQPCLGDSPPDTAVSAWPTRTNHSSEPFLFARPAVSGHVSGTVPGTRLSRARDKPPLANTSDRSRPATQTDVRATPARPETALRGAFGQVSRNGYL